MGRARRIVTQNTLLLKQKSVFLPRETGFKTQSARFSLEAGHVGPLCLCDDPQLPKFQTPGRKAGVHHECTICTINLGKLVEQGQGPGGPNSLINVSVPKPSSKIASKGQPPK